MKKIYIWLFLFMLMHVGAIAQGSIKGLVVDDLSGEAVIMATVRLFQSDKLIDEVFSDFDGYFLFENLGKGRYTVKVIYTGYQDYTAEDVEVRNGKVTEVNYRLVFAEMEEVVITSHHPWRFINDKKESEVEQSVPAPPAISGPAMTNNIKRDEISVSSHRDESTVYMVDGIRMESSGIKMSAAMAGANAEIYDIESPESGQMTAGEWNDLHNWEDWNSLLEDENYRVMYQVWGISTDDRYSVFVKNESDLPLANVTVELRDKSDQVIWISRTDKSGKAELWANVFTEGQEVKSIATTRVLGENLTEETIFNHIHKGSNTLTLKQECNDISLLDISFVVDATSSMLDEIDYLKSELRDVIQRTQDMNDQLDIRLSSVFYRDEGDDYVTRPLPFTADIAKVESFVNDQYAQGGGDVPEALHSALSNAVSMDWRDDAVKLMFVILDAPAHQTPEVLQDLYISIEEASKKGIKIIPVTASGLERDAEFLMKYMAMLTNGTYVFITDDSGIGNAHLDPVVDDFEVEKLNDLLVRLITSYSEETDCTIISNSEVVNLEWSIYPNPTVQKITITHTLVPDIITVHSNSGQTLMTIKGFGEGSTTIDLGHLVAGTYFISVRSGDKEERKKVILIR